jgi:hypothetical protein
MTHYVSDVQRVAMCINCVYAFECSFTIFVGAQNPLSAVGILNAKLPNHNPILANHNKLGMNAVGSGATITHSMKKI